MWRKGYLYDLDGEVPLQRPIYATLDPATGIEDAKTRRTFRLVLFLGWPLSTLGSFFFCTYCCCLPVVLKLHVWYLCATGHFAALVAV